VFYSVIYLPDAVNRFQPTVDFRGGCTARKTVAAREENGESARQKAPIGEKTMQNGKEKSTMRRSKMPAFIFALLIVSN
jgi:hypothetical protein